MTLTQSLSLEKLRMKIGQTIRILRTAQRISQGALAHHLSVSPGYLSLVEQDKREPSLGFLNRVSEYFEVPVGFLLIDEVGSKHANREYRRLIGEIKHAVLEYVVSRPGQKQQNKLKAAKK